MNTRKLARFVAAEKAASPEEVTSSGEVSAKWQGALAGAAATLLLTVLVASTQFVLFSFPAQHLAIMRDYARINEEMKFRLANMRRVQDAGDQVIKREIKRESELRSIDKHNIQKEPVYHEALSALLEIRADKGLIEGIMDGEGLSVSPGPAIVHSLDEETSVWTSLLDHHEKLTEERLWREKIVVVESRQRVSASYQTWLDLLLHQTALSELAIQEIKDRSNILYIKVLALLSLITISLLLSWTRGDRLLAFLAGKLSLTSSVATSKVRVQSAAVKQETAL